MLISNLSATKEYIGVFGKRLNCSQSPDLDPRNLDSFSDKAHRAFAEPGFYRPFIRKNEKQQVPKFRLESPKVGVNLVGMFQGAWRFAVVSVLAFGVWAEGPRGQSEGALYATCAVAFLLFSHLMMRPLLHAPDRLRKFSKSFIPAFLAYAVIWSACWFLLRSRLGEVLGSVLGCAVFAWVVGKVLGAKNGYGGVIAVMIVAHSIGYFLGGFAFEFRRNPPDFMAGWERRDILKLAQYAWGLFYGLGFGAGIGYAYQRFQAKAQPSQSAPLPS